MATWVAHLRLAENLLETIEELDAPSFALGNIAPDSGIPDEKWETFTPPKEVSHFIVPTEDDVLRFADLEFYRRYLLPMSCPGRKVSLLMGYFLHLVADNLWYRWIARPTLERFQAELEADQRFIWEVKRDWYGLDFVYLHQHPDSLFYRVFLDCEYDDDCGLDFMPAEGLRRQLDYIKNLYQDREKMDQALNGRPDIYLTKPEMDRFVRDTTRYLLQVHKLLWEDGADTSGYATVMEMLPVSRQGS
ncbi:MAG: hypothetical protein JW918_01885 [Anaerolineae bacterium]|nr:hypothetical protein [Anaerolineae bacterium]